MHAALGAEWLLWLVVWCVGIAAFAFWIVPAIARWFSGPPRD